MQKSVLIISMLSSWAMAVVYDQINQASGVRLRVLLYIAIIVMVFGLYMGLRTNNECDAKEEA